MKDKNIPKIPSSINILLDIKGAKKKEYVSSCGFSTLSNWTRLLDISISEMEIRKSFVKQIRGNITAKYIMNSRWNIIGISPRSIKKRFKNTLADKGKNYNVVQKSDFSLDEIIYLLQKKHSMMVLYTRYQSFIFDTLQKKHPKFDKYFGKHKKRFTYPYPHYALLVGLDGKTQTVSVLDPNTGKTENIDFAKRWEQFDLHNKHLGAFFSLAKKIGLMKPRTVIFLEETN